MLRPDQAFEFKSTRHETLTEDEELVYEELVRKKLSERPKLEDFIDESKGELYNKTIRKNIIEAEKAKQSYRQYATQKSEIFEAVLTEEIERSDWLEGAYTTPTTTYDDRFNNTDFVIEWEVEEKTPIRLAIDVTADTHISGLTKKYNKIKDKFNNNKGTTINYLDSASGEKLRNVENIPPIVLAIDKNNLSNLCEKVASRIRREPGSNKILAEDNIKYRLRIEIINQLTAQKKYFEEEKINYKKLPIYKNISRSLDFLEEISKIKNARLNDDDGQSVKLTTVKPIF